MRLRVIIPAITLRTVVRYFFLALAIACFGLYGYAYLERVLYQAQESREFDEAPGPRCCRPVRLQRQNHADSPRRERVPESGIIVGPSPTALIGRLSVPRLHLSAMVREGIDRNTLQLAIGHIPATALPGQAGNVGVAGHRDTFFRGLKDLKTKDEIQFSTLQWRFQVRGRIAHRRRAGQCGGTRSLIGERADAGDLLSLFLYRNRAQAFRREGPAGVAANAGTIDCGMMKSGPHGWPKGVSLKHASAVPAARILVIEDNPSDVFLLDRALKKQDLRFELIHLPNGGEALAFIRRQGAYADAAIPNLILVDLNLSKYTGEDILREIRSAGHLAGVPVCVWSSSRSRRDEARA